MILSDLRVPGLGGAEMLAHLRQIDESVARKLIFFTGDASRETSARLLAEAGVPVILKPFELTSLTALVEQQAGRQT